MSFWTSKTGKEITGKPEDSFVKEFSVIPNNTVASASIKRFVYVEKENTYDHTLSRYYEINYKLLDGEFKGREVSQKIKAFDGKPESIDRNLNLMKLIYNLCGIKPKTTEAPSDDDLLEFNNKILSVLIKEWSIIKPDGTGFFEGNFVSEVYKAGSIPTETGAKAEQKPLPELPEGLSALQRNANKGLPDMDESLPF